MRTAGKVTLPILFALLCLAADGGCGGDSKKGGKSKGEPAPGGDRDRRSSSPSPSRDPGPGDRDGPGESREAKREEAHVGGEAPPSGGKKDARSGILTAGSFDDVLDPRPLGSFLRQIGQDPGVRGLPTRFVGQRLVVTVKDGAGQPVGNARVRLGSPAGGPAVELVSHSDGRVVFVPAWDEIAAGADFSVRVTSPGGGNPVTQAVNRLAERHTVTLPGFRAVLPERLDLALVVDTTGSMSDELRYLQAELRGIVRTVHDRFPKIDLRVALVFYRDEGDEYVTRRFDFTSSVDEVRRNVRAQSAAGGGDPPEAMHRAVEEAAKLSWRDGNTARVLFLIADAPPHPEDVERTLKGVDVLRKRGVVLYPVAGSGYDGPCEFVMRAAALLTGGRFLFLTDDSGVGNAHAEPHLNNYNVERLDRLMVRLIAGELAGKPVSPAPNDIVRTVGKPQ